MSQPPEKTYVYIDSFNLYYGALNRKEPGFKWLDLHKWLSQVLLQNEILQIKYFTAQVSGKHFPKDPLDQRMYWRALQTLPNVEIIEGFFLFSPKKIFVTDDVSIVARIPEEKGTDVNLAAHLIHDAHLKRFETAIVISNDSDLAGSIRIATEEIGLKVGVLNPYPTFNKQLAKYATFKIPVRDSALLNSQFPPIFRDKFGTVIRPKGW